MNRTVKLIYVLCIIVLMVWNSSIQAQGKLQLKFHPDKTFKIAQFTDIHWDNNSKNCDRTIAVINHVLNNEKPDLAILTGDIVSAIPAREGWKAVATPFIKAGVPWTVTLGNHDAEPGISRNEIFELLQTFPLFLGSKGANLSGCGNYVLPIQSSKGNKTAANLYCFDSNSYSTNKKISNYDWIHFDQISWYRNESQKATASNQNIPLPSLAFFHIPIWEYNLIVGKETTMGENHEGVASADINSGIFASMLEKKDVMGIFVGHDHDNNYIGIHKDIALAFGQVTGVDAYGDLDRGSRIIELKEGEYSFDTWISTKKGQAFKYNYPSGLLYDDNSVEYSPSINVSGLLQGMEYKYYEGEFNSVKDLAGSKVLKTGIVSNFTLEPAKVDDYFGFEYNAFLKIDERGVYRFYSYSDDGSQLFIDGKLVVDNDGSHNAQRKDGSVALNKGFHKIRVVYFESYMGNELEVGISGLTIRETKIPDNMLYIKK
ncbi:metallophosphoesterase [Prolixibacteraceae bacterium Z1-6]|uniref:Metallophosphoesterase n=1 Tax=Draconibacterium aestuarii TaxID=2998507 RepID=A0A9X3FA41_9BACT|nr:metallophosphoesterase [Prolixibacteraceae bacterium Z1-6]